ncbi:MAG: hypothetical protein ACD_54C01180G0006 [uncultured bacterium]|nr:MAG: hypothetical protein ACD_54C01180G0006 [uncultured bacterium]
MADATEGCHHLIGDEQDVVALADLPHAAQIALWWDDDAARGLNRFGNEAADAVGPNAGDQGFEFGDQVIAELRLALPIRAAVRVGAGQVVNAVGLVAEFFNPVAVPFADRLGQVGRAVIGILACDDVGLVRVATGVVIVADHPHCGIHRR